VVDVYNMSEPEARHAALLARKGWDRRYSRAQVMDLDHFAIFFMPGAARELLP